MAPHPSPARERLPKAAWHWLCRYGLGHTYKVHFWGAGKTLEYDSCRRCGFNPSQG